MAVVSPEYGGIRVMDYPFVFLGVPFSASGGYGRAFGSRFPPPVNGARASTNASIPNAIPFRKAI